MWTFTTALTSSWEGSGALLSNGTYYDWGYNAAGQLGGGRNADSDVPVRVRVPARVTFTTSLGRLLVLRDRQRWTALGLGRQPERAARHRQQRPHPEYRGERGRPPHPGLLDREQRGGIRTKLAYDDSLVIN
jgi:hypothetical protein